MENVYNSDEVELFPQTVKHEKGKVTRLFVNSKYYGFDIEDQTHKYKLEYVANSTIAETFKKSDGFNLTTLFWSICGILGWYYMHFIVGLILFIIAMFFFFVDKSKGEYAIGIELNNGGEIILTSQQDEKMLEAFVFEVQAHRFYPDVK